MSVTAHLNTSLALLVAAARQLVATGAADPLVVARLQDAMTALEEAGADPAVEVDMSAEHRDGGAKVAIAQAAAELDGIDEVARTSKMLTARAEIGAVLMTVSP